ncbi:uncharacterized protein IL334_000453 [Kwoniella shivajii]|uniref:Uncharacterized protein n=1 Tax=Kwoniella shivajii TaxID=564305 RepID=A0ABZ1CP80_9TREE|nr:hypothetical protein IL334_000453 [Kwoniella shivajii]
MAPPPTLADTTTAGAVQAGPSKNRKQPSIAIAHDGSQSIRAQSKKEKSMGGNKSDSAGRAGMSKELVKAVLASPLTVAWPNIPRHLQNASLHALKELIPSEIADYHVSRARCHQKEKRSKRRSLRKHTKDDEKEAGPVEVSGEEQDVQPEEPQSIAIGAKRPPAATDMEEPASKKPRTDDGNEKIDTVRPVQPEILSHLVFGINEVLKSLETQIAELRIRLMIMGDALNGIQKDVNLKGKANNLLPTAPRSPSLSPERTLHNDLRAAIPLEFIIIPLLSINPPSLVSPIPQYCATYNALVYQHTQLTKLCRTRLNDRDVDDIVGGEKEEIRVVPLGAVEQEIAELVGLRRVACLGIRGSHPSVDVLRKLLPKSVLHAPRHSITLPIPTSSLKIYNSPADKEVQRKKKSSHPLPNIHYADLHIKGIKTKIPIDNAARKAQRLEEVRKKRVEAKIRKKEDRLKEKKRQ